MDAWLHGVYGLGITGRHFGRLFRQARNGGLLRTIELEAYAGCLIWTSMMNVTIYEITSRQGRSFHVPMILCVGVIVG